MGTGGASKSPNLYRMGGITKAARGPIVKAK